MTIGRGKRLMSWMLALAWFIVTYHTLKGVLGGELNDSQLDSLEGIYWTYTGASLLLVTGLMGLDASAKQIIPALKAKS